MNTRKNMILLTCLLSISTVSYADTLESKLLTCATQALESNAASISDPNEAISQALAECHQVHSDYSQAWLNNLQALGFSSTNHVNALVSAYSYGIALRYLNQNYLSIKHQKGLKT